MKYKVGDVVLVYGYKAHVRYVKAPPDSKSKSVSPEVNLIGVEFDSKLRGNTDGTYNKVRLFTCSPEKGIFVNPAGVLPYSDELYGALTVQRLYRGYLSRVLYLEEITFKFWNALECLEEKEALVNTRDVGNPVVSSMKKLKLEEDMSELDDSEYENGEISSYYKHHKEIAKKQQLQKTATSIQDEFGDAEAQFYEQHVYRGPNLQWPITKEFAYSLMEHFRDNPDMKLPYKFANELLEEIKQLMRSTVTGAVFHVNIPDRKDCKLVLVGDTHGQLNDVLWLFYKFGPPSFTNIYVFNGDIADRGKYATEIFLLLFAFKLLCPPSVVINRGNHESSDMNEVYGFAREGRVIVVHGGLFRKDDVTLTHLDNINRCKTCPSNPSTYEDMLMFDALWSDPRSEPGRGFSNRGADCISFGPDVTESFLKLNNLEVPSNLRGFEPLHDGRCVTLFSASNYCGTTGNYGGVVIFEADMSFEIQEYMAPSLDVMRRLHKEMQSAVRKVLSHSRMKELEGMAKTKYKTTATSKMAHDIHNKLMKLICFYKEELWSLFFNYDKEATGFITRSQWRAACGAVMGEKLPWIYFMRLLSIDIEEAISYNDFLKRFRIEFRHPNNKHENWREDCVSQVYESILAADLSMKEMQMVMDRGCDGAVSLQDFRDLVTELRIGLSEPQIKILMRIITANCAMEGDRVDIAEFLGRFKVIYSKDILKNIPGSNWIKPALQAIGKAILADKTETARRYFQEQEIYISENPAERRRSSALRAIALFQKFRDFDTTGSGYLSYEEFANAISLLPTSKLGEELPFPLTISSLTRIAEAIDVTGSGKINYFEFLQAFYIVDQNSKISVAVELWSHICSILFRNKSSIRSALHQLDEPFSGKIGLYHFRTALETLNNVLGFSEAPLTTEQIDSLTTFIDIDKDGLFDYEEFLDCFQPVDSLKENYSIAEITHSLSQKQGKAVTNEDHAGAAPLLSRRRKAFLNEYQFAR